MARVFVAVWPPDELVADLCGLPRKNRPGIRWVAPENWHVTLRFLGDADPDEVASRLTAVAFEPATIRYGPAIDVFKERVIVLPAHGLDRMAEQVVDATADLGTESPRSRFHGHLTLARLTGRARIPNVIGAIAGAEQSVGHVSLVQSTLRPQGPVYEELALWPVSPGFE